MKKIFLALTFCGLTLIAKSQTASVEQSTYGIQTGVLGIWKNKSRKGKKKFKSYTSSVSGWYGK